MTKYTLFALLAMSGSAVVEIQGHKGYLMSVAREDGSGRSFNVSINTDNGVRTFHVRTID